MEFIWSLFEVLGWLAGAIWSLFGFHLSVGVACMGHLELILCLFGVWGQLAGVIWSLFEVYLESIWSLGVVAGVILSSFGVCRSCMGHFEFI